MSDAQAQPPESDRRLINVALQGGGAHGAFTWGVLDGLLADERIQIDAISGTSAGAMNAIVLADGLVEGGRERARQQLREFWRAVSDEATRNPLKDTPFEGWAVNWGAYANQFMQIFDVAAPVVSPYQSNPFNLNPLRDLLARVVDFKQVASCSNHVRLFIAATNVHTGQAKVFTGDDVTIDAVMASACLPALFQAVEIGGEPYWDGGFAGNPPIEPLITSTTSADVLLVQINPVHRNTTPHTAREINDRINEISFNSPLLHELRYVEFVNRCIRRGELDPVHYREVFLHRVGGGSEFEALTASSKMSADWEFLKRLRDQGRAAMRAWLAENFRHIGERSTMDLSPYRAADMPGGPMRHRPAQKSPC